MKINQMIFPVMVFISFMLIGRWMGEQIEKSVLASDQEKAQMDELAAITRFDLSSYAESSYAPMLPASTLTYSSKAERDPIEQKNLLIIGVDNLSKPQPDLEGIWLVLYLPGMPQVTLMPVFPAVTGENGSLSFTADERLSESFKLNADGSPHHDFLKLLSERELWWTNFAVIDRDLLTAVFDYSTGSELGDLSEIAHLNPTNRIASPLDPQHQPEAVLLTQIHIIQEICHTGDLDLSTKQVAELVTDLNGHLNTDITPKQVSQDLKSMLVFGGGLICEFPSLMLVPQAN